MKNTEKGEMFCYKYPRPALTTDCVIFGLDNEDLKILLIKRGSEPFRGKWALPGGFIDPNESIEAAARRELFEETNLSDAFLEQLYTFGEVGRDPRERVISIAYFALVNIVDHEIKGASDADDAAWFPIHDIPSLAFDHEEIIRMAIKRLKGKVRYQPIGFQLLPEKFTLSQLQQLYEVILEKKLDKRNFRKKILQMNLLDETDEIQKDVAHRAARLYQFDKKKYEILEKQGIHFEI